MRRGRLLPPHARGCTAGIGHLGTTLEASPARAGMYLLIGTAASRIGRFPRTRGDVPSLPDNEGIIFELPPHARGCTQRIRQCTNSRTASPARAGMYPARPHRTRVRQRFPRTRGDVPASRTAASASPPLPPHARGCTPGADEFSVFDVASPARAGMYQLAHGHRLFFDSFPRTRGDVPGSPKPLADSPVLPPHARGCTALGFHAVAGRAASPARAGMYPSRGRAHGSPVRFPRTRGDVPDAESARRAQGQLPPHARGCTHDRPGESGRAAASPARAGMYRGHAARRGQQVGFPRTRGDVPCCIDGDRLHGGLPPHARGCTAAVKRASSVARASPARAGMYPSTDTPSGATARFPRTRGDVPLVSGERLSDPGLPPHARGCTAAHRARAGDPRASPARAGMYLCASCGPGSTPGFPRTRGDVPARKVYGRGKCKLPPHARGCTRLRCASRRPRIASPARAGMYPTRTRTRSMCCRFPRTRGDVPAL